MNRECPNCGQPMPSKAQHALHSAALSPEYDEKVREYVEYLIWKKRNPGKRRREPK